MYLCTTSERFLYLCQNHLTLVRCFACNLSQEIYLLYGRETYSSTNYSVSSTLWQLPEVWQMFMINMCAIEGMIHHCAVTVLNITRSVINVSWWLIGSRIYLVLTFILFNSFKASTLPGVCVTYQWEQQRGEIELELKPYNIWYFL